MLAVRAPANLLFVYRVWEILLVKKNNESHLIINPPKLIAHIF